MKHIKEVLHKDVSGGVAFTTLITVIGMTAVAIYTAMTYVDAKIAPVEAQAQQTAIISAQTQNDVSWIKQAMQKNGITP